MDRLTSNLLVAAVAGQLVGLLGYVDPLFVVLVVAGPLVTGAIAAARGVRAAWPAVLWASAGLNMLWLDWVVAREDVAFHAALSVVTALLALAGWSAVTWTDHALRRLRQPGSAEKGAAEP